MKFFIVLIFLFTFSASAQIEGIMVIREGLDFITAAASHGPNALQCEETKIPLSEKFSFNGADCTGFVRPDGELGPLGEVITTHMHEIDDALFFASDLQGVKSTCPAWQQMNKSEKEYFWVWLFASISWKESTCGAATFNRAATHGTAAGMLQLNQNRKDRAWRGGESGKSCGVQDIIPNENNLRCGIEILHELLKGKDGLYKGNGNIFGRGANSYWQDLRRPDGGKIIEFVKEFPPCRN